MVIPAKYLKPLIETSWGINTGSARHLDQGLRLPKFNYIHLLRKLFSLSDIPPGVDMSESPDLLDNQLPADWYEINWKVVNQRLLI
jgi:hypothetical protein